jgi:tRNA(His) 5'-end guanylyltransferase
VKFDELDARMRVFETAHDHCALPCLYLVARLDGRSFTRLTKQRHAFEAPFDVRFRDLMVSTVEHLMGSGLRVIYAYTQSDEIPLLQHPEEDLFGRKLRKLDSVLAGEASARFSLLLGDVACFDCRISQLPRVELVCTISCRAARTRPAMPFMPIATGYCASRASTSVRQPAACWACQ